jgi:hypothetical protein
VYGFDNAQRRICRLFVFPDTLDSPSGPFESAIGVSIASTVPFELRCPPRRIRSRERPMDWTAMPEASIDENRHFLSHEHNVSATP